MSVCLLQIIYPVTNGNAPPRAVRYDDLQFALRLEYGEMAEIALVCGADDGSELAAG